MPTVPRSLPDDWFGPLARASARLLMLDYDGTLAPFREERDEAVPYPGVRETLSAILETGRTRLVIVSGRAIDDLLPLLALDPAPEIWGSHGWEQRLPSGERHLLPAPGESTDALAQAQSLAESHGLAGRCETKPACLAVHWRGLSESETAEVRERASALWRPLAENVGLELREFDGGLELRIPGRDKGCVVEAILSGAPPGAFAAYLGDDLTDEDAFRALGSRGLSVLVREKSRASAASHWIHPPEELLAFLQRWAQCDQSRP
ncbi:trehalose-phosphatase [Candidatus Sumerlaeota bacterium]|nr:trehalose-phosphatase [Candidatus Sumerlaeota bacterium]